MFGYNWVDEAIVGIIIVSALISLIRGFVKEVLSLLTWILAAMLALAFGNDLAVYFNDYITKPPMRLMAAYALIFIATLIVGAFINSLIAKLLITATGWSTPDKIAGMLFGGMRGCLMIVSLTSLIAFFPLEQDKDWKNSVLLPHFLVLADWSRQKAMDVASFFLPEGKGFIDSIQQ
ncbi:MAG: CvpA family protein [Candidatus Endonucleobacter bathymodioli]|uniref:CvpA family protein n=1 Tax=Candidatus Endonucleibacter bathymodioli TaxID=539814 RepID=A0AA90NRA4_9GAMM|nr:CvpA family protein [Candidatus Endonucleobacter bathymodioli]